ncbi:hypothetical protein L0222_02330 [bacterium]|nr:hypothetical protein [bacterium]MCI0604569.1 hypothetical protein [bacterium]
MKWFALGGILLALALLFWILRIRSRSITSEKSKKKHFQKLANELGFRFVSDDYFVQLEGYWNEMRSIMYPHNFEGPGIITLLYLETRVPASANNWIEPNLSLGRALVEWKRQAPFGYEVTGKQLPSKQILEAIARTNYPFAAVTLPHRFSYSPLLQQSLSSWKNFVVLLAVEAGKKPAKNQLEAALRDAAEIAESLLLTEDNKGNEEQRF